MCCGVSSPTSYYAPVADDLGVSAMAVGKWRSGSRSHGWRAWRTPTDWGGRGPAYPVQQAGQQHSVGRLGLPDPDGFVPVAISVHRPSATWPPGLKTGSGRRPDGFSSTTRQDARGATVSARRLSATTFRCPGRACPAPGGRVRPGRPRPVLPGCRRGGRARCPRTPPPPAPPAAGGGPDPRG